jgi:hypothetical protein
MYKLARSMDLTVVRLERGANENGERDISRSPCVLRPPETTEA